MKINSETLLNSFLENNNSVIFAVDKEYNYLSFNRKHKEIMKATYGVDIVIGINALDCLLIEQNKKQAKEALDRVFMGETFIVTQEFGDDASLKSIYELYYYPLKKEGEIYGVTLFITDVSERILLEKRKNLYENRQLAFAQMIPDFLVISSSDGVRKYANKSYCDFFETTADKIIGINYSDFIPEEERDYYFKMLQKITPQSPSFSNIHLLTNSSGKSQWTLWHETGVFDNQSSLIEIISIGQNINEIVAAELEREQYIKTLEEAIFKTSHEVRQSIAHILGLAQLISSENMTLEEIKKIITHCKTSADKLDSFTRDLTYFIDNAIKNHKKTGHNSTLPKAGRTW